MKKRILSLMLALAMSVSVMTTTAAAEVEGVAPGGKLDTTPLTQAAVDEVFGKGSATLSGTTITLNKNVVSYGDYTDNIQLNVDCTLDLAGHTLRQDAGALTFNQSEGALAIRGNSTVKIVGGGLVKGGTDKRGTGRPAITTKDTSTLVIGEGVTVAGGDGKSNPPGGHEYTEGGDAIDMFGTEVTVYGIVKGGDSESHPTAPSNCYGGRGIHVRYSSIGSAVTVAEGGKVFGGKGADSSNGGYAGTGGSGIALEQGSECTVTVKGSVTGGAGGNNTSNDKTGGTGGDAVAIYGSSDLIVSVGGSVTGGNGGDSSSSRVAQNGGTGGNGIRTGSQPCSIQLDGTATGGKGGSCSGGGFAGKGGKGIYLQRGNNNIQLSGDGEQNNGVQGEPRDARTDLGTLTYTVDGRAGEHAVEIVPDKTEYKVSLPIGCSSVTVNATAANKDAKAYIYDSPTAADGGTAIITVQLPGGPPFVSTNYSVTFTMDGTNPKPDPDKKSESRPSPSENTANKPETLSKLSSGKGGSVGVNLVSGSADITVSTMNTLGAVGKSTTLTLTVSDGLAGGTAEIVIPGGFGKVIEAGRISYPMNYRNKAEDHDTMVKAVKGDNAVTTYTMRVGANMTLPTAATITLKTPAPHGTVLNIYKYDVHANKYVLLGKATAKDGRLTFSTKELGQMLFTTGTV